MSRVEREMAAGEWLKVKRKKGNKGKGGRVGVWGGMVDGYGSWGGLKSTRLRPIRLQSSKPSSQLWAVLTWESGIILTMFLPHQ